jgi:hypothetical protein
VALGVHMLAVAGAVLLGATVNDWRDAALLTLAEMVLLPTAVALTMRSTAPERVPSPPRISEAPRPVVEARASRALVVPVLSYRF